MLSVRVHAGVLAGLATCAIGAAVVTPAGESAGQPARTLAANQNAAQLDASQLLRSIVLPADATSSPSEPAGDNGYLRPLLSLIATLARADVHGWWTVPGSPDSLYAYIKAHRPAGARLAESGGGGMAGGTMFQSVDFTWPPIPGVLGDRGTRVTVTSLPGNLTGVLGQADSEWIVPRPSSEQVPPSTREIDITSAKLTGAKTLTRAVTNATKVRRIVTIFNAMPIAQPVTTGGCSEFLGPAVRVIRFKFRTRLGGRLLAQAAYTYHPGANDLCDGIEFSLDGHRLTPLIGGRFVREIDKLLGVNLTR